MKTIRDVEGERKYRQYIDAVGDPIEVVEDQKHEQYILDKLKRHYDHSKILAAEQKTVASYQEINQTAGALNESELRQAMSDLINAVYSPQQTIVGTETMKEMAKMSNSMAGITSSMVRQIIMKTIGDAGAWFKNLAGFHTRVNATTDDFGMEVDMTKEAVVIRITGATPQGEFMLQQLYAQHAKDTLANLS